MDELKQKIEEAIWIGKTLFDRGRADWIFGKFEFSS